MDPKINPGSSPRPKSTPTHKHPGSGPYDPQEMFYLMSKPLGPRKTGPVIHLTDVEALYQLIYSNYSVITH